MRFASLLATLALIAATALPARAFDTRASSAWVYDMTTGTVLMEKQADVPLPPASMSKLMTLYMLFEAVVDGRVAMDTRFRVSTKAKNMGGSTMFLNETDRPTVEELIKGIIVLSGNDACVVVAEGLGQSEEEFSRQMTERARALGLQNSTFANSSGWPHPNQRMSMRDLGILAVRLIEDFPQFYAYFGMTEFAWDNRAPQNRFNRNPLLKLGIGADGLKTGHTSEAGYGLVGSAVQGKRRVVFVLGGMTSETMRAEESERIVSWAFRQFVQRTVAERGTVLARAPVWMGTEGSVGLTVAEDLDLLVPALAQGDIDAEIRYRGPLEAPIAEGDEVAQLVIALTDMPEITVPLVADRTVARGGFLPRVRTAAKVLIERVAGKAAEAL